jgi:hypothetical protein
MRNKGITKQIPHVLADAHLTPMSKLTKVYLAFAGGIESAAS